MKHETYERDARLFAELSEDEVVTMVQKCVFAAKEKMLRYYSNVPMIDKLLIEEKTDLVSQTYIYAVKKAEKYPDRTAFSVIFSSALYAYLKILEERLGKAHGHGTNRGTENRYKYDGRHTEEPTEDVMMIKSKSDFQKRETDYAELKIDMENTLTEEELSIVEYRRQGYTLKEIAIIKRSDYRAIWHIIQKIKIKMRDYE